MAASLSFRRSSVDAMPSLARTSARSAYATRRGARRIEQRSPRPEAAGEVMELHVLHLRDELREERVPRVAIAQLHEQVERALRLLFTTGK